MRMTAFASRNSKEILRDPATIFFGLAFPIVILLVLSLIGSKVPNDLFRIKNLAPGIAIFGLSFISLFSGMLISKDRGTSLLTRLCASPLIPSDFIIGYALPLLPMSIAQIALCFVVAFFLGLPIGINILLAIIVSIPAAIMFIAIGLLAGSLLSDKQVGGVCGALLTNLAAWFSGAWIPLDLIGGPFKAIAYALPFVHAVKAGTSAISGDYSAILPHLLWVIAYAVIIFILAASAFKKKMESDGK